MNYRAALLLLFIAVLCSPRLSAQLTMFSGKVVGDDGNPVKGAIVQLKWSHDMLETRTDDDGSFYTTRIPTGMYRIGIETQGKYYKLRGIKVLPREEKRSYIFTIHGERLYLKVEGEDHFFGDAERTPFRRQD